MRAFGGDSYVYEVKKKYTLALEVKEEEKTKRVFVYVIKKWQRGVEGKKVRNYIDISLLFSSGYR